VKLLYLANCVASAPDKGERIRAYHQLRHLGARHEVHCLCLGPQPGDEDRAGDLRRLVSRAEVFPIRRLPARLRCLWGALGGRPLTLSHFTSRALRRRVAELAASHSYDAVIAYCTAAAPYALRLEGTPRVLDMVDVDSAKWRDLARWTSGARAAVYRSEGRRLANYERHVAGRFDRVFLTTSREAGELGLLAPDAHVAVLRSGIDVGPLQRPEAREAAHPTLVFTGQMDYHPNVDGIVRFVDEVLPALQRRHPGLVLEIVGRSPTARIRGLSRIAGVVVTGEVPDVDVYLQRAWVFVAPLRIARGLQYKVLEAMARGLPVVCSSEVMSGLTDGLAGNAGRPLVADGASEWITAIGTLVADRERRRSLGETAYRAVRREYPADAGPAHLERTLLDLAGESEGSPLRRRVAVATVGA